MIGEGLRIAILATDLPADEPWLWRGRVFAALWERHHASEGDLCPACQLFAPTHVRADGRDREEARPIVFRPGSEGLEVVLIGRATEWAQEVATCMSPGRLTWRRPRGEPAVSAEARDLREWLRPVSGSVLVQFPMPLRLKAGGRMWSSGLEPARLASALSLRLRRLRSGFGDGSWEDGEIDAAIEEAGRATVAASFFTRARVRRYSTRQRQQVWLDGQVGWARIEDVGTSFGRLLAAGEHLHVGKDTVMGCGQLLVREARAPR